MVTRGDRTVTATRARDNPFATDRLEALGYRSPRTGEPVDLERLLERLEALGRRAAVVGPEGSGKTTLLDDLEPLLKARGHRVRRLRAEAGTGALVEERNRGERVRPESLWPEGAAGDGPFLILDGADRLKRRIWRRVRRRLERGSAGALITSHRPGLLPTLTECSTSPALLARLVRELAPPAGTAPGSGSPPALPSAAELHARHRGNLRLALLELYDRCAAGARPLRPAADDRVRFRLNSIG
jgi:hypothetical protein